MGVLPSTRLVFDRKHKSTTSAAPVATTGLVQLEVSFRRERRYIGTGVKVFKDQWNDTRYVVNHARAIELNSALRSIMSRASKIISSKMTENGNEFSLDEFCDEMLRNGDEMLERSIFALIDDFIVKLGALGRSDNTLRTYKSLKSILLRFEHIRKLSDVKPERLHQLYAWCLEAGKIKPQTVERYLAALGHIVSCEFRMGNIDKNPFDEFNYKRQKARTDFETIRYISDAEMQMLVNYEPRSSAEDRAKDLFLFQAYTGMSFCDALSYNLYSDFELEDGVYVLRSRRIKTHVRFTVILLKEAEEILKKRGGQFKKICISNYDRLLHNIGNASIGKPLTSHMARHTFATWALRNGMSIEHVSGVLGHTNIRQTQNYAKILSEDIIKSFRSLESSVVDKKSARKAIMRIV